MLKTIHNCYDSHTHFWATGQVNSGLTLNHLSSAYDVLNLKVDPTYYRRNWLVGFGWNQQSWPDQQMPNRKILDRAFPDVPVFFSRVDGHASWLNTVALLELETLGFNFSEDVDGGIIDRDINGQLTGLLFDQAHIKALQILPDFTEQQHRHFFHKSQNIFNRAGFTHVRDLSMNSHFWQILRGMENRQELTVCIDGFITAESLTDLDRVMAEIFELKKDSSEQLRIQGVKIFVDGSLGSQTAFLSLPYTHKETNGLLIWPAEHIKSAVRSVWQKGLPLAVHCIGDQAAHVVVQAAREVAAESVLGRLHLEHVQVLRHETVQMMKPLHVTCHMQPCHWLSDKSWLKNHLPQALHSSLFQWQLLQKNKIQLAFGSDSPIESPSLSSSYTALKNSESWGIPSLIGDWKNLHAHPDKNWCSSHTEFTENDSTVQIQQVYFKGQPLL